MARARRAARKGALALCAVSALAALVAPHGAAGGAGSFVVNALLRPARGGRPLGVGRPAVATATLTEADLKPLSSYVLVKPRQAEVVTKGGLVLPSSGKELPNEGVVVAVGPGSTSADGGTHIPVAVEVGAKVVYSKYGPQKVELGGEDYALVQERDLLVSYAAAEPSTADLKPLSSYLLVRPKEAASATKGGIALASAKKDEEPSEGLVLAVGPGGVDATSGAVQPIWTQAGKRVIYGKYGAENVEVGGEDLVLVRDDDVLLSYDGEEPTLENLQMPPGKVLVRLLEEVDASEGGLLLSKAAAKPETTVGKVVAVSEGVKTKSGKLVPLGVEVGDMVRFTYGSEVELEVGKTDYRAINWNDCIAKWKV